MSTEITIDGESLTFEQPLLLHMVSPATRKLYWPNLLRTLLDAQRMPCKHCLSVERSHMALQRVLGLLKIKSSAAKKLKRFSEILSSVAVGVGNSFDIPTVRAIMLIRANTLARGFSGIRLDTLELILECLNRGVHPVIPEKGSLGAGGDLAPLAHFACVLIGEGEAEFRG